MMAGGNGEVVFRKRPFRMVLDVLLLLFWGFMVVVFTSGLLAGDSGIQAHTSFFGVVLMAGVVVGGIIYLIRILKVRGPLLRITPEGFSYALYRPEIVPWSEVAAMTVERGTRWTYPSYVYISLQDGTTVEIECEFFSLDLSQVLEAIRPYCDMNTAL